MPNNNVTEKNKQKFRLDIQIYLSVFNSRLLDKRKCFSADKKSICY